MYRDKFSVASRMRLVINPLLKSFQYTDFNNIFATSKTIK